MSEPILSEPVRALELNTLDVLRANPDVLTEPVEWQVTARADRPGDTVVIIDYVLSDGTEGRHEFDDREQLVIVRAPRYQSVSLGAAA